MQNFLNYVTEDSFKFGALALGVAAFFISPLLFGDMSFLAFWGINIAMAGLGGFVWRTYKENG